MSGYSGDGAVDRVGISATDRGIRRIRHKCRASHVRIPLSQTENPAAAMPWPENQTSVLDEPLAVCSISPMTGFVRNGCCETGPEDVGSHTVCVEVTAEFLAFSKSRGNDLSTPIPAFEFPGLKPGDRWCLCAARWQEALEAGAAPKVVMRATHQRALEIIGFSDLSRHAIDIS